MMTEFERERNDPEAVAPAPPQALPPEIVKDSRAFGLYQIAMLSLAAVVVLVCLGGLVLTGMGIEVPTWLAGFGGVALGYLGALITGQASQQQ